MKYLWLLFLFIVFMMVSCLPSSKENEGGTDGQARELGDLQLTAYQEYKKAEGELDKLYSQILEDYSDESFFKTKLEKAELAWIDFRDAQIEFLFPGEADIPAEVSSSTQYWFSMKELTEARITLLRIWLLELNRVGSAGND